mmetsp:Transcript_52084/g.156289  ORF Transcript_52084/g.156289 Transcript_52084/m.156289 type:complete len:254 (+) Transcript_52084:199-960(+)
MGILCSDRDCNHQNITLAQSLPPSRQHPSRSHALRRLHHILGQEHIPDRHPGPLARLVHGPHVLGSHEAVHEPQALDAVPYPCNILPLVGEDGSRGVPGAEPTEGLGLGGSGVLVGRADAPSLASGALLIVANTVRRCRRSRRLGPVPRLGNRSLYPYAPVAPDPKIDVDRIPQRTHVMSHPPYQPRRNRRHDPILELPVPQRSCVKHESPVRLLDRLHLGAERISLPEQRPHRSGILGRTDALDSSRQIDPR